MTPSSIVVTGAGSGIGRAICEAAAAAGHAVVLVDLDPSPAVAALQRGGASAVAVVGDVAQPLTHSTAREAAERLGPLTGWVNCAGVDRPCPLLELTGEEVERTVRTNIYGSLWGSQAAVAAWTSAGRGGALVNISSVHGRRAYPDHSVYEMTKAAIEALTRNVAVTYASHGIRANAVAPGGVLTAGLEASLNSAADPTAARAELTAFIPSGRLAEASEIADIVMFLLSPSAAYLTGQTVVADGGMTVHIGFDGDDSARRPS